MIRARLKGIEGNNKLSKKYLLASIFRYFEEKAMIQNKTLIPKVTIKIPKKLKKIK